MLVKWLSVSAFKMIVHPAMLPITVATFISVAGPGGFAEIGRHVSAVPTVTVTPESAPAVTDERPAALLLRVVDEETPVVDAPAVEPDVPSVLEIADESLGQAEEAPDSPNEPLVTFEVPASTTPEEPAAPPVHDDDPIVVPSTPQEPTDTPPDDDTVDDGAGDVDDDGDPPVDDDTGPGNPPEDDGDVGQDNPDDDGADDGGDDTEEAECDPPGNGPDPHDGVPPGHDQNGDGIDDRCQENQSEGQDAVADGTDDGTVDGNIGDGTADGDDDVVVGDAGDGGEAECDPPGNGHENHGTPPPGHDKNEDGIDDRCQDAAGDASRGERHDARKNNDDS